MADDTDPLAQALDLLDSGVVLASASTTGEVAPLNPTGFPFRVLPPPISSIVGAGVLLRLSANAAIPAETVPGQFQLE